MRSLPGSSILVCKSVHHRNTRAVADRIAAVLAAKLVDPDEVDSGQLGETDLVGVGSGIYYGRFHRSIRQWLKRLPENAGRGQRAFVFSTSGLPFLSTFYHFPLRRALQRKGFDVVGDFACRGHDTFGPLWFIGGLNRKHPDDKDLCRAERFAEQLKSAY